MAAAVGFAWGETGAWEEGADCLDRALHAQQGDCPVRAVEQCANYRIRLSGQRWQAMRAAGETEEARQALVRDIEAAIRELDIICQRASTLERLSLLGSACKRLARIHTDEGPRLEVLVNMANYYAEAMKLSREPDRVGGGGGFRDRQLPEDAARHPGRPHQRQPSELFHPQPGDAGHT